MNEEEKYLSTAPAGELEEDTGDVEGIPAEEKETGYSPDIFDVADAPTYTDYFILNNTPILDQMREGACTVFGMTKSHNEVDYFDGKQVLDAMPIWKQAIEDGLVPNKGKSGWSMYGAYKLFKEKGYILDWVYCHNVSDMQKMLRKNCPIYTGSARIKWYETKNSKDTEAVFVDMSPSRHVFCIIGDDPQNKRFIAANSRGEVWGDKGLFYIKYEDINKLYSKCAIIDQENNLVSQDIQDIEEAINRALISGYNLDENLQKNEAIFMVMRAAYGAQTEYQAISHASDKGIIELMWINLPLKRSHFLAMVSRALFPGSDLTMSELKAMGIVKNIEMETITRGQAALILVRAIRART